MRSSLRGIAAAFRRTAIPLAACLVLGWSLPASAAVIETRVPPAAGEKFVSADYRLWIPDDPAPLRCLIVRQHGCGDNGLTHADDLQWQALASRFQGALIGSHLVAGKDCADWSDPSKGSERAFLAALAVFAQRTRRPELTRVPRLLWGHADGAIWTLRMADRYPGLTIAVWARSQAVPDVAWHLRDVPIVFNYGEREEDVRKQAVEAMRRHRTEGALWAIAVDPESGPECRNSRHLALPFCEAVLKARLQPIPPLGMVLHPIVRKLDPAAGMLVDPTALKVTPAGEAKPGPDPLVGWLADAALAEAWLEYSKTGAVADREPPPVPTRVRLDRPNGKVRLRWDALADGQSGTRRFVVRRDGVQVGQVRQDAADPAGTVALQPRNDGDAPLRPVPEFVWEESAPSAPARWNVAQEDLAGIVSEPGLAVEVDEAGFVPLFDGKTFAGWTIQGRHSADDPQWTIVDGVLVARPGRSGWLRSDAAYDDFILRLEWKAPVDANGGVFVRVPEVLPPKSQPWTAGMEIQIVDDYCPVHVAWGPEKLSGSIFGLVAPTVGRYRGAGRWNEFEIRCEGPRVEVALNGTRILSSDVSQVPALQDRPRRGHLGLQNHGVELEMRHIRIKPLKRP